VRVSACDGAPPHHESPGAPRRRHETYGRARAVSTHAWSAGLSRLVAGVNTGRLDAYRRMLARGFTAELVGVAMLPQPALSSLLGWLYYGEAFTPRDWTGAAMIVAALILVRMKERGAPRLHEPVAQPN